MFRFKRPFFIITNFILAWTTFLLIYYIRYEWFFPSIESRVLDNTTLIYFLLYSLMIIVFNISFKSYEVNKITRIIESLILNGVISVLSMGMFGIFFFFTQLDFARFVFFVGFGVVPVLLAFYNKVVFAVISSRREAVKMLYYGSRVNGQLLQQLVMDYSRWFSIKLQLVYMEDGKEAFSSRLGDCDILIVDSDQNYDKDSVNILNSFELEGGRIYSLIDLFSYFDQSLPAEIIHNSHFELFSNYKLDSIYNLYFKRVGDILIASLLLIITAPVMIVTALLVKISSRGPVFYIQKRSGLRGKVFSILKFRSMTVSAEKEGIQLATKGDARVTWIGKLIRPVRIDELPQLFNILRGDMSFIGPRPERPELIEQIIEKVPLFKKRLLVKPGLTGWAQVKYAYVSQIEHMNIKLSYDLYYINNISILFDFKILLYTIETIIFRRGAI
jgi:exopolysaccharide biosynthesis polyprenyl glycosylphosphotransferase